MKIGAIADPPYDLDSSQIPSRVKAMEKAGVDSLWTGILSGESFTHGAYIAALSTVPKIAVGVLNPYTRHPLIVARGASDLHRLSHHREILVLGFGWPPFLRRYGIENTSPLDDMKAFVDACKELLAGKEVTLRAKGFRLEQATIGRPPAEKIPIFIAAERKKTLELTRRIAEGVFLGLALPAEYVRWVGNYFRQNGGTAPGFEISSLAPIRVTDDPSKVREELKPTLAYFLAIPEGTFFLQRSGFDTKMLPRIREALKMPQLMAQGRDPLLAFEVGNVSEAARLVPDDWVDACCIIGSVEHCRERIADYEKAGLGCLVLSFQRGFDFTIPYLAEIISEYATRADK